MDRDRLLIGIGRTLNNSRSSVTQLPLDSTAGSGIQAAQFFPSNAAMVQLQVERFLTILLLTTKSSKPHAPRNT